MDIFVELFADGGDPRKPASFKDGSKLTIHAFDTFEHGFETGALSGGGQSSIEAVKNREKIADDPFCRSKLNRLSFLLDPALVVLHVRHRPQQLFVERLLLFGDAVKFGFELTERLDDRLRFGKVGGANVRIIFL